VATLKKNLGEAQGISAPLRMHLAKEDEFISKDAQARIKAALADVTSAKNLIRAATTPSRVTMVSITMRRRPNWQTVEPKPSSPNI
jgi:hypothetical protein